ncbi:MAG: winged helix-turn-helix domain-containing protein [Candidatus Methylomirabilis sp.]|nr:winged helix-turn-helix domain-containing protein [Deltaproteobacteria bacterium]
MSILLEQPVLTLIHSRDVIAEVRVDGHRVPTSPLERQLLALLARRPGAVVLRDDLLEVLAVNRNVLKSIVWRLRQKLPGLTSLGSRSPSRRRAPDGAGYALLGLRVRWDENAA